MTNALMVSLPVVPENYELLKLPLFLLGVYRPRPISAALRSADIVVDCAGEVIVRG